ncbi:competence type IV pilus major pilin ComGC [Fictibacillus aquaticus]|uniref:ComG operon protein 3 n=1 Tax=Fictibacillus aquaticus TaxID=2021314 RepID=A0A235F947_9BACL|nr:competence type IV pilus major pilin ComGC [Fictibacillus aquaticus]OYD57826.1 competence protein ComG [Fictibacillus aquaticus]
MKNEKGFTLIEMMIVLLIISVLMLIAIPSITKNNEVSRKLGCEATIDLLQGQVGAYEAENNATPTLQDLLDDDYVDTITCPDGTGLVLTSGVVEKAP